MQLSLIYYVVTIALIFYSLPVFFTLHGLRLLGSRSQYLLLLLYFRAYPPASTSMEVHYALVPKCFSPIHWQWKSLCTELPAPPHSLTHILIQFIARNHDMPLIIFIPLCSKNAIFSSLWYRPDHPFSHFGFLCSFIDTCVLFPNYKMT